MNYDRVIISYNDNSLRAMSNVSPEKLASIQKEDGDRIVAVMSVRDGWTHQWSKHYETEITPPKKKLINVNVELIDEQKPSETEGDSAGA